jgi:hypothetical protein
MNMVFHIPDKDLLRLLDHIRRINLMLWGFDYPAASDELTEIKRDFGDILYNSEIHRDNLLSTKDSIEKNDRAQIQSRLTRSGLKGERLQVQTQQEIAKKLSVDLNQTDFEPTAMSFSALATIISRFEDRVNEAKYRAPKQYLESSKARLSNDEQLFGQFLQAVEKHTDTNTLVRAYQLEKPSISMDEAIGELERRFDAPWHHLNIEAFPYRLRAFLRNAMATLVVYDHEHYRLEITHNIDRGNKIGLDIAREVRQAMNDALQD